MKQIKCVLLFPAGELQGHDIKNHSAHFHAAVYCNSCVHVKALKTHYIFMGKLGRSHVMNVVNRNKQQWEKRWDTSQTIPFRHTFDKLDIGHSNGPFTLF